MENFFNTKPELKHTRHYFEAALRAVSPAFYGTNTLQWLCLFRHGAGWPKLSFRDYKLKCTDMHFHALFENGKS